MHGNQLRIVFRNDAVSDEIPILVAVILDLFGFHFSSSDHCRVCGEDAAFVEYRQHDAEPKKRRQQIHLEFESEPSV